MLILLFCFIAGLSCYFAIITNFPLIACYFSIILVYHGQHAIFAILLFCYFPSFLVYHGQHAIFAILLFCYFAIFHHYWFTHGQHAILLFCYFAISIITGLLMDSIKLIASVPVPGKPWNSKIA